MSFFKVIPSDFKMITSQVVKYCVHYLKFFYHADFFSSAALALGEDKGGVVSYFLIVVDFDLNGSKGSEIR